MSSIMNNICNIFAILTTLLLINTINAEVKVENSACTAGAFVRIEKCCKMPKIITKDIFSNCVPNGTEDRAQDGALNAFRSFNGTRGGPSGPACLMKCILEKAKLTSNNGDPDYEKVKRNMIFAAERKWKPHVDSACKYCASKIKTMDSSQLPTHVIDGQVCKSTPVLYIACVKHRLALICEKEDINTEDEACPQKMADIRNCNPLVMRNNGYPMLRAHRMRKNRQKNYKPIEGPTTPMKVVTKSGKKQTTRRGRSG